MKQPRALSPLFLTELWERFGFYTVQSLLIFYLLHVMNFTDKRAYTLLGEFTALVYLAPLAGGLFADRILGPRYSILIGAIFLGLGYFALGWYRYIPIHASLSLVIVGNGFLKPNISSFLGEFYHNDDPRRDAGFTLFYVGINIGALFALAGAGFIQEKLGWSIAFASAGVGMILSLITFCLGFRTFENRGLPIARATMSSQWLRLLSYKSSIAIIIVFFIFITYFLLISSGTSEILQSVVGVLILLTLIGVAFRYNKQERNRLFALLILMLASVIFWGLFFQSFSAVNVFTARNVDRSIGGFVIPPSTFIALESFFILLSGPLLAWFWQRLHLRKKDPTSGMKFSLAMFFSAGAMGVLVLGIYWHQPNDFVNAGWIVGFYALLTLGEMLLSPIGLSMVTALSPPQLSGMMMGVWFMSLGFGGQLSGYLSTKASMPTGLAITSSNLIYARVFYYNALLALIAGIILLALSPWLKRLMNHSATDDKITHS